MYGPAAIHAISPCSAGGSYGATDRHSAGCLQSFRISVYDCTEPAMKMKVRERLLACTMTGMLLLLLWWLAAWIEMHSHTFETRQLSFAESRVPPAMDTSTPAVSPEIHPEAVSIPRSQIPEIQASMQTRTSLPNPKQRTKTGSLQLRPREIPLHPVGRTAERSPAAVKARSRPGSPKLTLPNVSHAELPANRLPSPQAEIKVAERAVLHGIPLEIKDSEPKRSKRVLKEEEAKKIVQWMQLSESELPAGIKQHVDYQPGNLSSTAHLEYEGEIWDIYLMARMPSEELHVVIARGNATYYVVDPSFQREGRRFRIGTARRIKGEITGITSEERAASSQDAVLHYDVFLAWWDTMRLTLE